MKRKSPRGIPDFSRQASRPKEGTRPDVPPQTKDSNTRAAAPAPRIKPQSTSAKSGQRGQ